MGRFGRKGGYRVRVSRNRFIRRTGKYSTLRRFGRKYRFRGSKMISARRMGVRQYPKLRGKLVRGPELKWTDVSTQIIGVPYFASGAAGAWNTINLATTQLYNYQIAQGVSRVQFIGRTINLVALEVQFRIKLTYIDGLLNATNWPVTNAEQVTFKTNLGPNLNPKVRMTVLMDKESKQPPTVTPDLFGFPDSQYGFMSPWDIDVWKVVEDKVFKLKVPINLSNALPVMSNNDAKTEIYFRKRFPLRMTAEMSALGGGLYSVNIDKRIFITLSSNMPWFKNSGVGNTDTNQPIQIDHQHARLWWKDP